MKTPLYRQYQQLQQTFGDSIICIRLGDFYEVIGENAVTVAEICDLTLTGRNVGDGERVAMVGFPYSKATDYIGQLAAAGKKVALCDPV